MWVHDLNDICDAFKGTFPYYLLAVVPIFLIISPVSGSHEFPVYRMQHFDLHGVPHGCRKASINLEARSLSSWSTNRHCILAEFEKFTIEQFRTIKSKAGALILVLPRDLKNPTPELLELESDLVLEEVQIPVYMTPWSLDLQAILDEVVAQPTERTGTGLEALLNGVAANGYQMVVPAAQPSARTDIHLTNIQGALFGQGVQENLPTVAIVAHYDAFSAATELSFGGDSNASGVAVLLEIARIFSSLYSKSHTHGKFNLLFLLSSAGKFNYLGSKKYLEDQIDSLEVSLLQDAAFVLCLDSLSRNSTIHMHVSKPPKDSGLGGEFLRILQSVGSVKLVHKKINLAEEVLAWEHERYSIRRLPAFTLSSLLSHRDLFKTTLFDVEGSTDVSQLTMNAGVIAESLARLIYNMSSIGVLEGELEVEESALKNSIELLSSTPRAQQLLSDKNSPLLTNLKEILAKYVQEVKMTSFTPDKRDPDVVFYDVTSSILNVYSVKPAVFDLFLTIVILSYLAVVYLLLTSFPDIYNAVTKLVSSKTKVH